ncbi:HAD family hydrolase [Niallia sp. Marseille-Q9988]
MTIKAILFDLDDTLLWDKKSVQDAFLKTCKLAEEKFNISAEHLEEAVRKEARALYEGYDTYAFTKMIGINPFEGLWGEFLEEHASFPKMREIIPIYRKEAWTKGLLALGIDDPKFGEKLAEAFPEYRKQSPHVYEETFSILDQLKGKYSLLLLTNGSPHLQNTKLSITPEISPYFDHIVISGDFGKGKPDPSIFEHAVSLLGVDKSECLMVGDNLMTDIKGANKTGIKSVWINREHVEKKEIQPTYEIHDLHDLLPILNKKD